MNLSSQQEKLNLYNCNLLSSGQFYNHKTVIIEGGIIQTIKDADVSDLDDRHLNLSDNWLLPGFIDLQIYGAGGQLFHTDFSKDCLSGMLAALLRCGVTSFLPAMTSASIDVYKKAISEIQGFNKETPNIVLGLNIESPFINPKKLGFHNPEFVGNISKSLFCKTINNSNMPVYLTFAPEVLDNLNEFVTSFTANVKLSIGHTLTDFDEAKLFFKTCNLATHILNGMTGMTGREPGVVAGILLNDNVYASVIPDGFHVNRNSLAAIIKAIGHERIFIISDGMPPIQSEVSTFDYESNSITYKDGVCLNQDDVLSGTAVDVFSGLKNIVQWTSISFEQAISMVTTIPAKIMGVEKRLGKVEPGFVANLVVMDKAQNVKTTLINGSVAYEAN